MIDGEGEAREERDDDATSPLFAFTMCANDAMDDRVTNLILNRHIFHRCPVGPIRIELQMRNKGEKLRVRCDEELIFNVDKMFGKLDGCTGSDVSRIKRGVVHIPLRYAFWMECSTLSGVPSDHGPADRQICSSQVPVNPS